MAIRCTWKARAMRGWMSWPRFRTTSPIIRGKQDLSQPPAIRSRFLGGGEEAGERVLYRCIGGQTNHPGDVDRGQRPVGRDGNQRHERLGGKVLRQATCIAISRNQT